MVKTGLLGLILLSLMIGADDPVRLLFGQIAAVLGLGYLVLVKVLTLRVAREAGAPLSIRRALLLLGEPAFLGLLLLWTFVLRLHF